MRFPSFLILSLIISSLQGGPGAAWAQRPATPPPAGLNQPQGNSPALPSAPGQSTAKPMSGPGRTGTEPGTPTQPLPASAASPTGGAISSGTYGQYPVLPGEMPGTPANAGPVPADTLHVTIEQARAFFMQRNYNLIAQRYNVNTAQAAVVQAGLRDNPNVSGSVNAYNPQTKRFFPFGPSNNTDANGNPTGNTVTANVQQLINLSHSRAKLVQLSSTSVAVQQAAFEDLLRTARYQLAQTFYNVIAERRRLDLLKQQREQLERLLVGFREQLRLGTVAGFDVTRLELEHQGLEKDRSDQLVQLGQDEAALRVFLATPGTTFVAPEGQELLPESPASLPTLTELTALAYQNRPDLRAASRQIDYAAQNLRLQRALAVPKLMLGLSYASYGSTYPDFYALEAAIDVPVFNRNQGNIQAAQVGIQQNAVLLNQVNLQVGQDVAAALEQLQHASDLRNRLTPQFVNSIQEVSRNATRDYQRRLIDLVSFIDKIRAYKDAKLLLIDVGNRLEQAKQQVNYVTNTPVYQD